MVARSDRPRARALRGADRVHAELGGRPVRLHPLLSLPAHMQPLSAVELRRFGLTVGGLFLAFGVVSRLRGHDVAPFVLWSLGVLLVAPALMAPRALAPIQRAWMPAGALLGEVTSRTILTVL